MQTISLWPIVLKLASYIQLELINKIGICSYMFLDLNLLVYVLKMSIYNPVKLYSSMFIIEGYVSLIIF